ncbi:antA/AntB antirepressor family protein [Aeromonas enteropelogenes]|uniref:antA/AntB antirepressor family protein n=1 Tax=Aeromonas enteropelogenes TaxID=29489 RepID=UPI002285524E|nr:antA/AntB antirepressor family protein [Aeromonas enteropelogenes]MCZ0750137.1 antA/AntB antirepressor family protein [Aeromonas enteropelogenes]
MTIHQSDRQTKVNGRTDVQDPLIPVGESMVGNGLVQTANARELHAYLDVKKDFSTWIKDRIEQYGFIENQDFIVFPDFGENPKGGRPSKEYFLTLDMAKELSMVERNQKGKEARQYFIQCERVAQQKPADPIVALNDPATMRGLLLTYTEKVLELEEEVEGMKPKVGALDLIATADGSLNLTEAAKALQQQPRKFNRHLCSLRWIYKRAGGKQWLGYQDKVQQGLVEHKVTTVPLADGGERLCEQVRITSKGLTKLAQQLSAGGLQ